MKEFTLASSISKTNKKENKKVKKKFIGKTCFYLNNLENKKFISKLLDNKIKIKQEKKKKKKKR